MESDVKFSWTLLRKESKTILIGMGIFFLALFFMKASFNLSVISSIFYFFLLLISIFDIKYRLIFNKILLLFAVVFLVLSIFQNEFLPRVYDGFFAGAVGAVVFLLVQILSKNGIGGGDIKFIFCIGLWLGAEKLLTAVYIALVLALITVIFYKKFRQKGALIPFGFFLSIGAIISFLCGEKIIDAYGEFFL